jgi:hypothetical protein
VRNRSAERAFPFRPLDIDMDPLLIAGALAEVIDARLVDGYPVGDAEFLSDPLVQAS